VAHHGSRTSSTATFLETVKPRLALISAGINNLYHHPAPEVVERLQDQGARILRTDQTGEILIRFTPAGPLRIETPGAPR
jgi:competence protein ComEC